MNNHGFKGAQMAMKKIVGISAVVIILLAAGAVAWLFASGKLIWASTGTSISTASVVCTNDTVTTYNDASAYIGRGGSSDPTIDTAALKNLATDIKGKKNYQEDATCQTVLFWVAIKTKDYSAGQTAAAAVQQLYEKGVYANSNIRSNSAVSDYPQVLSSIAPSSVTTQKKG